MQKIQTFLWLNDRAEDAATLYASAFRNSKFLSTMPGTNGKPMGLTIEAGGRQFILFNGGPQFHPTPAISFFANCETPQEVDEVWKQFADGGSIRMELNPYPWSEKYGWVEDKYGVSWQVNLSRRPPSITPSFLFAGSQQGRAEEALNFYIAQFPNSSVAHIARYEPGERGPAGQIKFSAFSLDGQDFIAMDSGVSQSTTFTPGISMFVNCETQQEVDHLWEKLSEGGRKDRCGWLQDKFGVSWQIVPTVLGRLMADKDRKKAGIVMQAMMKMNKLVIKDLQEAYDG